MNNAPRSESDIVAELAFDPGRGFPEKLARIQFPPAMRGGVAKGGRKQ